MKQSISIKPKEKEIIFHDQNKNMVFLLRFVFGLNLMNAVMFFLIFNNQNDAFKWIWMVFAIINLSGLYLMLTKVSTKNKLLFSEIQKIQQHGVLGILLKLKDGKLRKVFVKKDSPDAKKLQKVFPNS